MKWLKAFCSKGQAADPVAEGASVPPSLSPDAPRPKERELHHLKRPRRRHITDQDLRHKQHTHTQTHTPVNH